MGSEAPKTFSLDQVKANLAQIIAAGEAIEPSDKCYWCGKPCNGTCLGMPTQDEGAMGPVQMKPSDPAYFMLSSGPVSTPKVHRAGCYICEDPEFAQMGLPLCNPCPECSKTEGKTGHIPADDEVCDDCGYNLREHYERESQVG